MSAGRFRRALLAGLLAFALSGCGGPAPSTNARNAPVVLEFWTLQLDAFRDTLVPMFRAYERAHPGVRIHWVDVPFSEGPKRTLTAMMGGHPPDVVNLNPDFSAVLANRRALLNLNTQLSPTVRATYLPVAWQAATLFSPDGRQAPFAFGLPWYVTSSVTLYNRALLKEAGLSAPPAGFEDLPAFAEAIRAKTRAYGMMPLIAENGNFLKELQKIGVPLYDARGRAIFATGQAIDHLARFAEMYRQGWIPAEAVTEGHQAAVGRFQAGTLATLTIGPNFLKIVKENAPAVYRVTGVAPQFPETARARDFSLMLLVVPAQSGHPRQAVDFAAFITNAENQLALAKAAPVLPSVSAALGDPYFNTAAAGDLLAKGRRISAAQLLGAKVAYQIQPRQNAINDIVDHEVQLALLGKLPPTDALRRAQREINDTLEERP